MNSKSIGKRFGISILSTALLAFAVPNIAFAAPAFSKSFSPATIGPGSASKLTFVIDSTGETIPLTGLTFTDVLPTGITLATPASASTDCTDGIVVAADGGTTISLTGGRLGAGKTCKVTVNVVGTATATNTSGALTSSLGNSGTAIATLTIDLNLAGISKIFSPTSIPLGGVSKLTFTIKNDNEVKIVSFNFADTLPTGMTIAAPANASTTCGSTVLPATFTATSGSNIISLVASGFTGFEALAGIASCTASVYVTTNATGVFVNTSGALTTPLGGADSGFATAALNVPVQTLVKSFLDDPVAPGGKVKLKFTLTNLDRDNAATAIAFDDDLGAVLTGLAPNAGEGLPKSVCGGTLSFSAGMLGFSGGSLAAGGTCNFTVLLDVPAGATPATYTNTTGTIAMTINSVTVTGNTATDQLVVSPVPLFTKEFTNDPIGAGGAVTLRFSITNTSTSGQLTDIAFTDELTTFLPFPVAVTLPASGFCGAGSLISLQSFGTEQQQLKITKGLLAAGGSAGDSCTFDVVITIPAGFPAGTYTNMTSDLTATLSGGVLRIGGSTAHIEAAVGGKDLINAAAAQSIARIGASDQLVVVGAPTLSKSFTNDPVIPGGTVNLQFTLSHDALAGGSATAIAFTDNLAAAITGLTATALPLNNACDPDGPGGSPGTGTLSGTTSLSFSGASLAPGQTCTFSVTLNVPANATAGNHTNTTSNVVATVSAVTTTGNAASDNLKIAGLVLSKEFINDPVLPGSTVILRFTINNTSPVSDATAITFEDILDPIVLPGLNVASPLPATPCGAGSTLVAFDPPNPTSPPVNLVQGLRLTGGNLLKSTSCTFDVVLNIPGATASSTYSNTTSLFFATIGGGPTVGFDNASDTLVVTNRLLFLTKEFTNDPAIPNSDVNLKFTLSNLDTANAASAITFTDDLNAALSGLAATMVPPAGTACNGSGTLSGTGTLTFTGGSLAAGASCTFSATVRVPAGAAPGSYTNQTSAPTGTINSLGVTGDPAIDKLVVNSVTLSKSFSGVTTTPGTSTLTFILTNASTTALVDTLSFTDNLTTTLAGLVATSPTQNNICGTGSSISGTSMLTFTGGSLLPGGSCTIVVNLQVPAGAAVGNHTNTTSTLTRLGLDLGAAATADLSILGTVGGTVSGLAGTGLVLRNNLGNDLTITANGAFVFTTPLANGSAYAVSIKTQPTSLNQTCTVGNGSGNLAGANITNVTVSCVTNTFTVGGTLSGLAAGNSVILRNNGGNDLTLGANGAFTFSAALVDGSPYAVSVLTQPTTPNQTCSVSSGSGTLAGVNITNVVIVCATNTFTVGGTVSGLAGVGLVLQNNTGNNLPIAANGSFVFTIPVADGSPYAVTVLTQPSSLSQTCTVTGGSGSLAGANVTNVAVTCVTNTFTVGGNVSGFPPPAVASQDRIADELTSDKVSAISGFTLVLQNNGGDDLTITANGTFSFATPLADGSSYVVTVLSVTQPSAPAVRICSITNGTGVLNGTNVVTVVIACRVNDPSPIPVLTKMGLLFLIFAIFGLALRQRTRIARP